MFIGHYGLAYMIKKKFTAIPLWALFLSVQLLDVVAFILVLFGVEVAGHVENQNPFLRNNLDLPYSHSLMGALLLSVFVYAACSILQRRSWALVLSLCVFSHWFIDFIVHTPDLTIFFGKINTGLGLWNYPYLSFGIEVVLVLAGWLLLGYGNKLSILLLVLIIGGFSGMFFGTEPDVIKNSQTIRTAIVLVPTMLFVFMAYCSERSRKKALGRKEN